MLYAPQQTDGWKSAELADVTELARAAAGGTLTLAVVATNRPGPSVNPAGLLAKLVVTTTAGERLLLVTDSSWRSTDTERPGWQEAGYDDTGWAGVAGPVRAGAVGRQRHRAPAAGPGPGWRVLGGVRARR